MTEFDRVDPFTLVRSRLGELHTTAAEVRGRPIREPEAETGRVSGIRWTIMRRVGSFLSSVEGSGA